MSPVAIQDNHATIPLGEYVFRRIKSLGVHSIFGVPGDFNLAFLECLYDVPEMRWYGTCNELNGAYAADGYSRTVGTKFGVLVTTMGVGELSAMNGINGSFAEYVPVLHIVGTTPTGAKRDGRPNHHLSTNMSPLQPNDHYVYEKMAASVSCNVTSISNPEDAPDQIDQLICDILTEKKPGYLYIPCDLATAGVANGNLEHRLTRSIDSVSSEVTSVADIILESLYASTRPCLLADVLAGRFELTKQLRHLVELTHLPNACTMMAKSLLNEQNEWYIGDFHGDESAKAVGAYVRSCDLLVHFGNFDNETNSGHYSVHKGFESNLIVLNHRYVQIGTKIHTNVSIEQVLPAILARLDLSRIPQVAPPHIPSHIQPVPSTTPISETDVLQAVQDTLQPGDTLVVETGSILYGIADIKLPENCRVLTQPFYLSIGMGLPCSFGASVAKREMGEEGRVILVEGDGAAQMTVQELANFNREGLNPLILLLNNDGYTVERAIKGPTRDYNDIRPNWKWTQVLDTFGMTNYKCRKVGEIAEMRQTLEEYGQDNGCTRMVEIVLGKLDVPYRMRAMLNGYK